MADSSNASVEVKSAFIGNFASKVRRDWTKAFDPKEIIICQKAKDVVIIPDTNLNCRVYNRSYSFCWTFTVLTFGKRLRHVALTLDNNLETFSITSVSKDTEEIGLTGNGREWIGPDDDLPEKMEHLEESLWPPNDLEIRGGEGGGKRANRRRYSVKVRYLGHEYGTYRQNVIFGFEDYPVVLRRICVDCRPAAESARLRSATDYQLSLNPNRWTEETHCLHRFSSAFVPARDIRETGLEEIYPYPDKSWFFLTYDTLTEDRLTLRNYRERLHELVYIEELARHEQVARYNEISHMRLLLQYVLVSSGDGSTVAKYAPRGELFAQLPLSREISEDTKSGRLLLRGCNSILFRVFHDTTDLNLVFEAHVEDKCASSVYVRLSKHCVDTLHLTTDTDIIVEVQFVLSRLPFLEWHRAIDCLPNLNLVFPKQNYMNSRVPTFLELLQVDGLTFGRTWRCLILNRLLNVDQKKAVAIMTASLNVPLPPVLLLGPFGTGKTFTIAQALHILLTEDPNHKILLCTHSNSAADLYVKEYFHDWYKNDGGRRRLRPVRIYFKGRARNTVHPTVQEYCLIDERGCFRDATNEDLRDCGLIVTTLSTSTTLTSLNLSPTHIVIDEAAQALECEVLTALALANCQTRLILAGDHAQLAPEIYSDLADERGLGVSLLERIYQLYPEEHPCRIHLRQNYRSHADIIKFTSEVFYEGRVNAGNTLLQRHPIFSPLMFYAVEGEETQGMFSTGYAHANEAYELANRVAELKCTWPVDCWGPYGDGSIGVLAYYAEQVQRIRTELRKRKLYDVTVERVLNAQGKQFTAVFISVVRTRTSNTYSAETRMKDYGFLTNSRLLNTAMTRAKCLVAVVGDPVGLMSVGSCRKLWRRYLELADLRGIDWATLEEQLEARPEIPPVVPLNPLAREFVPRLPQPSCLVEYVPVPMMYPVMHCSVDWIFNLATLNSP